MSCEGDAGRLSSSRGGGRRGDDAFMESLVRIEEELTHVAKREDIKNMEAKIMRCLSTLFAGAAIGVLAVLVRTFV